MDAHQARQFIRQRVLRLAHWAGFVCVAQNNQRPSPGANWGLTLNQVEQIVDVYMGNRGGVVYVPRDLRALPGLAASVFIDQADPCAAARQTDLQPPT